MRNKAFQDPNVLQRMTSRADFTPSQQLSNLKKKGKTYTQSPSRDLQHITSEPTEGDEDTDEILTRNSLMSQVPDNSSRVNFDSQYT
jgi:hypothetical protein